MTETSADWLDFGSPADELITRRQARFARWGRLAILALCTTAVLGAAFYHIDVYASAPGRVQPIGRSKSVQAADQGRIIYNAVREGSHVRAGDILFALDPTIAGFDQDAARVQRQSLEAEIARRKLEQAQLRAGSLAASAIPFPADTPQADRLREQTVLSSELGQLRADKLVIEAKIREDDARRSDYYAEIASRDASLRAAAAKLKNQEILAREGWQPQSQELDTEGEVARARYDLANSRQSLAAMVADTAELRTEITAEINKAMKDNADALETAETKLEQSDEQLLKSSAKRQQLIVRAPVTGFVQGLAITTLGQVTQPGEPLMTIVPDDRSVQIEALVSDSDIGFVEPGQTVVVKVNAYPYTRYGVISGKVLRVARDSINSRDAAQQTDSEGTPKGSSDPSTAPLPHIQELIYPVVIELSSDKLSSNGENQTIRPGMAVEVEIKTASRSVLEYMFSPIFQSLSEAGHER